MSTSIKDALHQTIDQLSEQDCQQILAFVHSLQQNASPTLKRLASDPTFKIPSQGLSIFRTVDPIQAEGISASNLLLEDRR
ncbi:hypothetical protein ACKFKG_30850 [Phormidesmis sp. 146-35]